MVRDTFGRRLAQATVSESLSSRFKYLDGVGIGPESSKAMRRREPKWDELELLLYEWQHRMEKKKATVNDDLLRMTAMELWTRLPMFSGQPVPKWSNKWLQGFKQRHALKQQNQHGEAVDGGILRAVREIKIIREILEDYKACDVYSMDETGLFWKAAPDRSFTPDQAPRSRNVKARITAALACNADGSHKLPIWFIGKSTNPRCFKHVQRHMIGAVWKSNSNARVISDIMVEYLKWFDRQMRGRKVVLLLDKLSAHELGVEAVNDTLRGERGGGILENTKILWLPKNGPSEYQPLDHGIIQNWKSYYRRQWIQYMAKELDADRDPYNTMDVLKAIRWGVYAWNQLVPKKTIANSFSRSNTVTVTEGRLIVPEASPWSDSIEVIAEIKAGLEFIAPRSDNNNRTAMQLHHFINPPDEDIDDDDDEEDIVTQIVERYGLERDAETDEEDTTPTISIIEALNALQKVRLYEDQNPNGDYNVIKFFDGLEKKIHERRNKAMVQPKASSIFM